MSKKEVGTIAVPVRDGLIEGAIRALLFKGHSLSELHIRTIKDTGAEALYLNDKLVVATRGLKVRLVVDDEFAECEFDTGCFGKCKVCRQQE